MQNLGKIFLLLFLSLEMLYAGVSASLEPRVAYRGESVTYKLTMSGNDIEKPLLSDICGNNIVSTGSQTSIESINGSYSRSYILSYEFVAQKSCEIGAVAVNIDGKTEYSNTLHLTVKEPTQDRSAPFVLELKPSKQKLYVGEPFTLKLTLTQSLRAQAVDSKFVAPSFKGFWLKSQTQPLRKEGDENVVTTFEYTLAPQRAGELNIQPAELKIATRAPGVNGWGTFAPQVKWRSYYSNTPKVSVEPIPNGASLIGDFTIASQTTQKSIHPNEAFNVTVVVEGEGNLEDIKSFKPYIPNVNIFDEKIEIKDNKLSQKLAFVSDANFTIPAFELAFFNTKTQKVKKIHTEPIAVEVVGAAAKSSVKVERPKESVAEKKKSEPNEVSVVYQSDYVRLVIAYMLGVLSGLGVMFLLLRKPFKKEKSIDIKDEKLLFMKLLPYRDDSDVAVLMEILENNSYSNEKKPLDKRLLKEVLKRYKIS